MSRAAPDPVDPHDVVVLNKVVCCDFDADALVGNVAPAARLVLALSLPQSRGLRGALARGALAAENVWRRLRGDPFRAYVHDVGAVMRLLRDAGLTPRVQRRLGVWHVAVVERRR